MQTTSKIIISSFEACGLSTASYFVHLPVSAFKVQFLKFQSCPRCLSQSICSVVLSDTSVSLNVESEHQHSIWSGAADTY